MRFLKFLIILLLLVFPFGELLRFTVGNNIAVKPMDVLASLIAIWWVHLFIAKKIVSPKFHWYYFAFPIVGLVSLASNSSWLAPNELLAAGLYWVRWISYLGVFLALLTMDRKFKLTIVKLLALDGLLIVLAGFVQYFFFQNLKPWFMYGWDDHLYRIFSVFLDPNFAGALFCLYIICLGGLLLRLSRVKSQHVKAFGSTSMSAVFLKKLLVVILVLSIIALLMTFSRSALIMFVISASLFFFLIQKKKFILILFASLVGFIILLSPWFNLENVNLFREASSKARLDNYSVALSIINEKPLLGVGFNSYRYAKEDSNVQMGWTNSPSHADAGVDNSFLFVLATTGIVGLAAYLSLWYFLLRHAWSVYRTEKSIYAVVFIASTVGIFFSAMFINSLFYPAIMLWLWVLASYTIAKE